MSAHHRLGGARKIHRLAVDVDLAAIMAVNSEKCAHEFGALGSDQAGDAQDFSGMKIETDVTEHTPLGEVAHAEAYLPVPRGWRL